MPACPVPLCAHHVREVYQYGQHLIEERLLPTVTALLADQ